MTTELIEKPADVDTKTPVYHIGRKNSEYTLCGVRAKTHVGVVNLNTVEQDINCPDCLFKFGQIHGKSF